MKLTMQWLTHEVGPFFDHLTFEEDWQLAAIFGVYHCNHPAGLDFDSLYHDMMERCLEAFGGNPVQGLLEFLYTAWDVRIEYFIRPVDRFCNLPLEQMPLYVNITHLQDMPCDPRLLLPKKELPCPEASAQPALVWQVLLSRWRLQIQR